MPRAKALSTSYPTSDTAVTAVLRGPAQLTNSQSVTLWLLLEGLSVPHFFSILLIYNSGRFLNEVHFKVKHIKCKGFVGNPWTITTKGTHTLQKKKKVSNNHFRIFRLFSGCCWCFVVAIIYVCLYMCAWVCLICKVWGCTTPTRTWGAQRRMSNVFPISLHPTVMR